MWNINRISNQFGTVLNRTQKVCVNLCNEMFDNRIKENIATHLQVMNLFFIAFTLMLSHPWFILLLFTTTLFFTINTKLLLSTYICLSHQLRMSDASSCDQHHKVNFARFFVAFWYVKLLYNYWSDLSVWFFTSLN